jgi:mRNA interferase MazF
VIGADYIPSRGDAVWITFPPQTGHEQLGRRSAVVLSPDSYNAKVGLVILCPIITKIKGYPFEGILPSNLPIEGAILSDQVKSLDRQARKAELICRLPLTAVRETLRRIPILLSE